LLLEAAVVLELQMPVLVLAVVALVVTAQLLVFQ